MIATAPQISFEVRGDKLAAAELLAVAKRGADIRPLHSSLQPIFAEDERTRFGLSGPGWKPLDEATIEVKRRQGLDPRILRATGALYASLTNPAGGNVESALLGSPTQLRFGTDVAYARFHQYGQGVPKRELIDPRASTVARMAETVESYVAGGLP